MGFLTGLLSGFQTSAAAAREQARRDDDAQREREDAALKYLAQSDDPEIAQAAIQGMLDSARGVPRKKGWLESLIGGKTPVNPALSTVLQMIQTPVSEGVPIVSGAGLSPIPVAPTPPVAPTASTAIPPPPPSAGASPQPLPAGASAALVKGGAGPTTPAEVATAPPSPGIAPSLVGPPILPPNLAGGTAVGRTASVTSPRRVFLPPEERMRRQEIAKNQAEVEGLVAGLEAVGVPHAQAVQLAQQQLIARVRGAAGSTTPFQSIAGEAPGPDGKPQLVFGAFDQRSGQYVDAQQQPIPGFRPRTVASSASLGTDREALARATYGLPFGALTSPQQQDILQRELAFNQQEALARGTGTGQAAIQTELSKPIGIEAGANQGVSPTTPLRAFAGVVPLTADQREAVQNAQTLKPQLAEVRELVKKVFPPTSGLFGGLTAAAVLMKKQATRDPDYRRLQGLLGPLKSQVARVIALEKGNLSAGDVTRAETALPTLEAALLAGDTQESALAALDIPERVVDQTLARYPTPTAQLGGAGGTATPPPGGLTGMDRIPPAWRADVQSALDAAKPTAGQPFVVIELTLPDGTSHVAHKYADGHVEWVK